MRTINVNVNGMFIQKDNKNGGVKGEANATQLHIVFDETWSGYGKRVIWRDAYGENPVAVDLTPSVDGLINGDTLTFDTPIPGEPLAHPGWCTFTLDGYQTGDPSAIALTVSDSLRVYPNDTDYQPAEPTPSQAQQIMAAIEQIVPDMQEIATEAKSWAVGGTGSREGEDTNNAKYYCEQAEDFANYAEGDADDAAQSAVAASGSASAAAASATESASYAGSASQSASASSGSATAAAGSAASAHSAQLSAETAQGKAEDAQEAAEAAQSAAEAARTGAETAEANAEAAQAAAEAAKTAAESAKSAAESARGAAESAAEEAEEKSGEAAQSAGDAAQSASDAAGKATLSESWAVGGTGTREGEDTNNAKYWAGVAQGAAGGGVTTFKGRSGAVVPEAGDYTAEMVGADPAGSASAVQTNLTTHINDKENPHNVTAEQVGALAKQTGTAGQLLGFTDDNVVGPVDAPQSGGKRTARFTVGTSVAGWTAADCDYLCDGTDDQVEINAAIQALPTTGGEVVILDGTYNITATVAMNKDNVKLSGNGTVTILKRMWNSSAAEGVVTVTAANGGCCVENLQIDGNKETYTNINNYGIYLSSSNNNTVIGNNCNNSNYGIYLSSSSNNTITGNPCNNNSYGIYLDTNSNNNIITGSTCNNNSSRGIYLSGSSNNTITGNNCNNSSRGIYLSSSSDNNIITGNNCNNSSYGIYLSGSSNNTITGNNCNNNTNYGIYLSSSSNNNTITGNTCNNNSYGVRLSGSDNNTITGNTCIRGTGQASDYTNSQYTIQLYSTNNNHNFIACNNIMGKNYVSEGGTGNEFVNNKYQ